MTVSPIEPEAGRPASRLVEATVANAPGREESERREIEQSDSYSHVEETLPILPAMLDEAADYAAPLRWYTELRC